MPKNIARALHTTVGGHYIVDHTLFPITFEMFNSAALEKGATIPNRLHYQRANQQRRIRTIESRPGHTLRCIQRINRANERLRKLYEEGRLTPKILNDTATHIEADLAMSTHEALMRMKASAEAKTAKSKGAAKEEISKKENTLDFGHIFSEEEWKNNYLSQLQYFFPEFCRPLQAILIKRLQQY
ncbi:MAG: hypothetical protein NUV57_05610 [archaeon]|nr:hypothetical protein [archaeon]